MFDTKKYIITFILLSILGGIQFFSSVYYDRQAKLFVESIKGTQAGPIIYGKTGVPASVLIRWEYSDNHPPSCSVNIFSIITHQELNISEKETDEGFEFTADQFEAIHLTKNGHVSIEPIYTELLVHLFEEYPGKWDYQLTFHFHCDIINSEWLSWIQKDMAYITKPVVIDTNYKE